MMTTMVFKVRFYDITTDEFRTSKRMATAAGAKLMGGELIGSSGVEVPEDVVEPEGWTAKHFDPAARNSGFQKSADG